MKTRGELVSDISEARDAVIELLRDAQIGMDQYREAVAGLNQAKRALQPEQPPAVADSQGAWPWEKATA
jgi:hypothetical protein